MRKVNLKILVWLLKVCLLRRDLSSHLHHKHTVLNNGEQQTLPITLTDHGSSSIASDALSLYRIVLRIWEANGNCWDHRG